ncbi:MAG TPA: hypothetical protein VEY09_12635 [Pyrinomonadaceae bacterium]|nr:hypothetical protein [Pyrinomonadaceae bacterium]
MFRREVLLVEVERWCGDHLCRALTRVALTKGEARAFEGFECGRCGRWNECRLTEHDVPDWWAELSGAARGRAG